MSDDSVVGSDSSGWSSEDELVIDIFQSSSCLNGVTITEYGEASSSAGPSNSKLCDYFVNMGFPRGLVSRVIKENGEENADKLLEELLTYSALESSPQRHRQAEPDPCSSESSGSSLGDFKDEDSFGTDDTLLSLVKMGFMEEEALVAMERLGPNSSIGELVDFIGVAQMAKADDSFVPPEDKPRYNDAKPKKRRRILCEEEEGEEVRLPNPMVGFGVPTESNVLITQRKLPEDAMGPPFFYYENVALAPKGVWESISRSLYGIKPEFVDSKYFSAAARKRGYIHNLPIANRLPLLPLPQLTIHDALPLTKKWWPSWDTRTKLNCLTTVYGSAKLTERIRKALEDHDGVPPEHVRKFVLHQCRKWNLVWVGRNKVAPLEPHEMETLLGFQTNHTRGGGISRTDIYKSLGNAFQVDTVAYHLSVLKEMYPDGINLLSLFSGIGGAEVALHQLGIPLKNVVSVEKSEVNRNILRGWWEQTDQKGELIDLDDVQKLDANLLEQLMNAFGGFDLVIGGSPCNNLAGGNRHSRDGLEGKESSLFFDYVRILKLVRRMSVKYR